MYLSISRVSLFFSKLLRPETINLIDILDETLSLCLKIVPFFFLTELTQRVNIFLSNSFSKVNVEH